MDGFDGRVQADAHRLPGEPLLDRRPSVLAQAVTELAVLEQSHDAVGEARRRVGDQEVLAVDEVEASAPTAVDTVGTP